MQRVVRLAVLALTLSTSAAIAAPNDAPPSVTKSKYTRKDPSGAVMRSVIFTLGGYALTLGGASGSGSGVMFAAGFVGILAGPSTGYWYGTDQVGGVGLVARGTAVVAILKGIDMVDTGFECDFLSSAECASGEAAADRRQRKGEIYIYGGLGLLAASTIYDFVNVYYQTESWNHEHGFDIEPMVTVSGDSVTTGLALSGKW